MAATVDASEVGATGAHGYLASTSLARVLVWLTLAFVAAACGHAPGPASSSLAVIDGELVVTTADGRTLRSSEMVGSILEVGATTLRVEGVARDPSGVVLHHVTIVSQGHIEEFCTPDPDGQRWTIAMERQGHVELVCSSGAIGKCIRWRYPPPTRSHPNTAAQALHDACVRMVRADYGGDGTTHTRDGTSIRFCDRAGIHRCKGDEHIEAAWSGNGAACVAHPRLVDLVSLDELASRYPRLRDHLGSMCTMAAAIDDPQAVLFDWSP